MQSIMYKLNALAFSVCLWATVFSQQVSVVPPQNIPSLPLEISTRQTSVIIFPTAIKSVDRGDGNVLAKTIKEISNVLKVKAATDSFQCTNMHVFTADGNIFSFNVNYQANPIHLTLDLTGQRHSNAGPATFSYNRLNEAQISSYAEIISGLAPVLHRPRSKWKGRVRIEVSGIYQGKGIIFFQFCLLNASAIPYEVDFSRYYVRDRKISKRSSVTEREIMPAYQQQPQEIDPYEQSIVVVAFDRFTIADNKYFVVEFFEKNGDRLLSCKLKGKDILKAVSPSIPGSAIHEPSQP